MVLALALVHHLAISNNVPLPQLAGFLATGGKWLVIEFVPKSDSQVERLLVSREDIFPTYTREDLSLLSAAIQYTGSSSGAGIRTRALFDGKSLINLYSVRGPPRKTWFPRYNPSMYSGQAFGTV